MAFNRLSLAAFSLLLLSLLVIASAGDYYDNYSSSKDGYDGIPTDSPLPKPEEEEAKPEYGTKPAADSYKPKPEDHQKPTNDESKEYNYQPKPEEKEKLLSIAIEGTVLCKSGSNYHPIQGALAKVTCEAIDEIGMVKTIPICRVPTDEKGYFYAPLHSLADQSLKLKDCKAFLEGSPLETCSVPSDVNKGMSGATLTRYGFLNEKHTKLYSVGPFFYTPAAESSVPNNGY